MHVLPFLSLLPLLVTSLSLPDAALEGLAVHLEDEAGNVTYVHESDFEAYSVSFSVHHTAPDNSTDTSNFADFSALTGRSLAPGDNINCVPKVTFNIIDLHTAMVNLADQLSCAYIINTNPGSRFKFVAATYYSGSAVVYICNYANKYQQLQGAQLVSFLEQVFNYCGQKSVAGWYYNKFQDMSWGYTGSSHGYCQPGTS
ncbi:hypothetical protein NQ176_g2392 [Zarea fungicola]|uniref:Uncharacterized protein n=1 Tax=Zarea fungicola TaxID=93591 RepID=A0ACC1NND5_9HYPO|nr:hypothetical protein NQ176_g2392 [Lecanicillium fungicola]